MTALKFADFSDAVFDRDDYQANCETRYWAGRDWLWPKRDKFAWLDVRSQWGEMCQLVLKHCPQFGVAVQAGGCCGMVPWLLWEVGFDHVHTFEPEALNFYCLSQNIEGTNVVGMHAALGKQSGSCGMTVYLEDNVGAHFVDRKLTTGRIPMVRLGDLRLERCDAIFLDAESFEPDIMAGAAETIERCKPSLITAETISDAMVEQLLGQGYALQDKVACDRHFLRV